jgi:hypothetical protein
VALPANSPLQLNPAPFNRKKSDATSTIMGGGYLATSPTNMGAGFVAAPGLNTAPIGGGFDAPNVTGAFGMGAPMNIPGQPNSASPQTPPPDPVKQAALYALAVALILLGVWTLVK